MGLLTQLNYFCISLGFIPGNIFSPYPDQAVAVSVKKHHNKNDNSAQDYDMPRLEFYLAFVFVKIPYQSPHSGRHADSILRHFSKFSEG